MTRKNPIKMDCNNNEIAEIVNKLQKTISGSFAKFSDDIELLQRQNNDLKQKNLHLEEKFRNLSLSMAKTQQRFEDLQLKHFALIERASKLEHFRKTILETLAVGNELSKMMTNDPNNSQEQRNWKETQVEFDGNFPSDRQDASSKFEGIFHDHIVPSVNNQSSPHLYAKLRDALGTTRFSLFADVISKLNQKKISKDEALASLKPIVSNERLYQEIFNLFQNSTNKLL